VLETRSGSVIGTITVNHVRGCKWPELKLTACSKQRQAYFWLTTSVPHIHFHITSSQNWLYSARWTIQHQSCVFIVTWLFLSCPQQRCAMTKCIYCNIIFLL